MTDTPASKPAEAKLHAGVRHAPDPSMLAKTEVLVEALPYLQRYAGQTFVVKYGGHAMGDPELARDFAEDIVLLKAVGIRPVVVHGGGPQIGAMLKRLGHESRFVDGLRVTDAATAEVAEMVLGAINKELVRWINEAGGKAVGLSGKDAGLVRAEKVTRTARDPDSAIEQVVDLGFVGEPAHIDRHVLDVLGAADFIPVVAPIGVGDDGHTYNINADTCAGAVAAALNAARLFLLTDVPGVLSKEGALLTDLTPAEIADLVADGTISGGMIPKLETCVGAVEGGVDAAVILDGRIPHAMLLEIFTRRGAGTLIRRTT
jgi:acetylglutamate kinase